jgi:hypothetical protein
MSVLLEILIEGSGRAGADTDDTLYSQNSNNTSVAIALPRIGMELHVPEAQLQWLVSAYPLSSVR